MDKKKKSETIMFGTRYPPEVLDAMKQIAEQHGRSFNSEVIWALRKYIAEVEAREQSPNIENRSSSDS